MSALRFVISIFGDRHVNMLFPLLYSIEQSCPEATASIYWEDINEKTRSLLKERFTLFQFTDTNFDFTQDITKRISSKTLVWELAAHQERNNSDWLLFIDADMLVVKNPLPILETMSTDIVITERNDSPFWINSGVIACRNKEGIASFFTQWRKETQRILNTPELFSQANDKKLPYGGADQMSLQRLIQYSKTQNTFAFEGLTFRTIPCRFLNETYSVPITEATHIIHYKGGWRDILFFGGNFTPNRTKQDSWEMYILYLRTFQESINTLNKKLGTNYSCKNFGLVIPWYLDRDLQERSYRYFFYVAWRNLCTFFPRLKKFLLEKFFS